MVCLAIDYGCLPGVDERIRRGEKGEGEEGGEEKGEEGGEEKVERWEVGGKVRTREDLLVS